MLIKELMEMAKKKSTRSKNAMTIDPDEIKTRKRVSGYGLLGTKYKKNPKYRDKPRQKKASDY